jgi:hypothetical protein
MVNRPSGHGGGLAGTVSGCRRRVLSSTWWSPRADPRARSPARTASRRGGVQAGGPYRAKARRRSSRGPGGPPTLTLPQSRPRSAVDGELCRVEPAACLSRRARRRNTLHVTSPASGRSRHINPCDSVPFAASFASHRQWRKKCRCAILVPELSEPGDDNGRIVLAPWEGSAWDEST